ncbi:MAG: HD domain-containing protein [Gemmatimonadaceae bacterium]|nr:HD domain-containing protein [Gemmatimonadaceae bacterium]
MMRRWRPQVVLHTKLGRRFVTLFILCALVPVAAFGILADRAVSTELRAQALARVQRAGKDASTSILQQFTLLDEQLESAIRSAPNDESPVVLDKRALQVETSSLAALPLAEQERVRAGKPQVRVSVATGAATLQLVRWAPSTIDSARIAVLTVNMRRVVGGVSGLDLVPPASVLCTTVATASLGCVKAVDSDVDGHTPIEATARVFLRYAFAAPELLLTVSESDEEAFAPLQRFRALFVPVALSALFLAALVAQITIRRHTEPLAALDAGTRRIAAGDFAHLVDVDSDDEFGQLASAFNGMTRQLNRQFNTLALRHDVDVAVLGANSRTELIEVLLSRIHDVASCDAALMLMPPVSGTSGSPNAWRLERTRVAGGVGDVTLSDGERVELLTVPESGYAVPAGGHRSYLRGIPVLRAEVYPVRVSGETVGALILGVRSSDGLDVEDRNRVRQLVAQVCVAFSNLQLVDELRSLNSGALEALARTTDAASPWTAGHSVRVTAIAVAIAKADGCDDDTVDLVRRGALLHDIGKLAVPVAILDKPAPLTADERTIMNAHPDVGTRILQPIAAFAPLLPMVRSHHERWDGAGYPDRLRGDAIHPLARLLAVADVAESLLAARPYRDALPLNDVVQFILDNAGKHFDPHFAQLFVERVRADDACLLAALTPSIGATLDTRRREVA